MIFLHQTPLHIEQKTLLFTRQIIKSKNFIKMQVNFASKKIIIANNLQNCKTRYGKGIITEM